MHCGKHTKSHLVTYSRKRSTASKVQIQGRYEVQMPYAKTARLINFCTYWLGYDGVRLRESGPCFPQIWYGQQRWLHSSPPALPHQKDDPILSGVQEGLKVWIKYHIGHGPRLKWSNMFVRAAGESTTPDLLCYVTSCGNFSRP